MGVKLAERPDGREAAGRGSLGTQAIPARGCPLRTPWGEGAQVWVDLGMEHRAKREGVQEDQAEA